MCFCVPVVSLELMNTSISCVHVQNSVQEHRYLHISVSIEPISTPTLGKDL